jgi:hypothetical protein
MSSRGGVVARDCCQRREGRRGRCGSASAGAPAPAPEEEVRARDSGEPLPPNTSARRGQPPSGPVLLGGLSKYWGTVLSR